MLHDIVVFLRSVLTDWMVRTTSARKFCQAKGSELPTIRNAQENAALFSKIKKVKYGVWLGLNDNRKDGQFEWTDDELAKYKHWAPVSIPSSSSGFSQYLLTSK